MREINPTLWHNSAFCCNTTNNFFANPIFWFAEGTNFFPDGDSQGQGNSFGYFWDSSTALEKYDNDNNDDDDNDDNDDDDNDNDDMTCPTRQKLHPEQKLSLGK